MFMDKQRERIVVKASVISIFANLILVGFKAVVGFLSNSVAIISDAINNLSDALSSIITIIGAKLAGKTPDRKHPYGYGRIEYVASLAVSAIVLYAGITALIESVKSIFAPSDVDYDTKAIVVLIAGIAVKFLLGIYVKKKGHKVDSDALVASGTDAFNDAILSASVLASAVIYLLFRINLEAYVGILVSIYIIHTGIKLIIESVNSVLGERVENTLSRSIKREIMKEEEEVEGVFDLILTDYGPTKYMGSVHIEVPDTLTVADIDKISRSITKRILKKYGVVLHTIGVYSINTKDKDVIATRKKVEKIVFAHKEILQMHGFYQDVEDKIISFDIIIDFDARDHKKIYKDIYDKVHEQFEDYKINITLDVDTSD